MHGAGLKLSTKKCILLQKEVGILAHIVSGEGIATDPANIATVHDWEQPCTVKQVCSVLGLALYYSQFIPLFVNVASPLTCLMHKDAQFY